MDDRESGGHADAPQAREPRGIRIAIPYEAVRINAAAVYCSDGRIGDHMDEFLHNRLGLPRYDRLACPGGPVALAGRLMAFWEARGVLDQLRFLIEVHEVRQVVLIAHAGCAYYSRRLRLAPAETEERQREDLQNAASAVRRIDGSIDVAGFFAHVLGSEVWCEPVFASEPVQSRLRELSDAERTSLLSGPSASWITPTAAERAAPHGPGASRAQAKRR